MSSNQNRRLNGRTTGKDQRGTDAWNVVLETVADVDLQPPTPVSAFKSINA